MNGADFPGSAEMVRAAVNNNHQVAKKNGTAPKRGAAVPPNTPGIEPLAGPVVAIEATAIDAPMWPLQAAAWLQPVVTPSPPIWSGLSIEHHNRIPMPEFVASANDPVDRPELPEKPARQLCSIAEPNIPQSDLALLGWDPRAICWKKEPK
jgi:hypothetical protein